MALTKIVIVLMLIGVVALIGYVVYDYRTPGQLDAFAQCLKDKGATFYGAFWCPHCQNQKKMFGKSAKLLPYTECSLPDASGQNQTCNDKKIESYPTWEFADGTREIGEVPLEKLAEKTSCSFPGK